MHLALALVMLLGFDRASSANESNIVGEWWQGALRQVVSAVQVPQPQIQPAPSSHRRGVLASRLGHSRRPAWGREWRQASREDKSEVAAAWILAHNPHVTAAKALKMAQDILDLGSEHRVDPRLMISLVTAESAFNDKAISPVGACGLSQLMPETAARFGVRNPMNARDNLQGCARYLRQLLTMWHQSRKPLTFTAASYNAGEGAVQQYGKVPPYAETEHYVSRVLAMYHELGGRGL